MVLPFRKAKVIPQKVCYMFPCISREDIFVLHLGISETGDDMKTAWETCNHPREIPMGKNSSIMQVSFLVSLISSFFPTYVVV